MSGHRVDPTAAVCSATKFAAAAVSDGLRQESRDIRVTVVSPGFARSGFTHRGGSPRAQSAARTAAEQLAIPASAIAEAIAFAIGRPANVDVDELVVRPTAQDRRPRRRSRRVAGGEMVGRAVGGHCTGGGPRPRRRRRDRPGRQNRSSCWPFAHDSTTKRLPDGVYRLPDGRLVP
ncbi:hypothetical protein [Streptomyces sp. HPF1205]|uniref:hypothetical protein n=1 Tax=Streptomyces sp. HPF1205 TaxID=2873262 RepID=UPI001CED2D55|nr:hypothetical protein [Streptomyces sp. HPF1205]